MGKIATAARVSINRRRSPSSSGDGGRHTRLAAVAPAVPGVPMAALAVRVLALVAVVALVVVAVAGALGFTRLSGRVVRSVPECPSSWRRVLRLADLARRDVAPMLVMPQRQPIRRL